MGALSPWHLLILLAIVVIVIGGIGGSLYWIIRTAVRHGRHDRDQ